MMDYAATNRKFLLELDAQENREARFYWRLSGTNSSPVILTQENDSNPRIKPINKSNQQKYIGVTELIPNWDVRIVWNQIIYDSGAIDISNEYFIDHYDNPNKLIRLKIVSIENSRQQKVYWRLILSENGTITI